MSENMQAARTAMINSQLKPGEVNDPRILAAFSDVPREAFLAKSKRGFAYIDEDIEVASGRYLMEPLIFGRLLVEAGIKQSDIVLDIGCATGYSSAVIAHLAEAVVAIEEDKMLAEKAEALFAELGIMNAAVVTAGLQKGKADQGPYDVILLEGAVDFIPQEIIQQLADGGRLLCVKQSKGVGRAHVITRDGDIFAGRDLFDAHVEPLPGFQKEVGFVF